MSAAEHEPVDEFEETPALEYYTVFDEDDDEHKGVLYDPENPACYIEMSIYVTRDVEAMA